MRGLRTALVFLAILLIACALRLPRLAQRPMHCDEAVNADKFGTLLEQSRYEYNPADFHGPTLYYLTLLPARLMGETRYTAIDEVTLRLVPAMAGIALVAAPVLLVPFIGATGAAAVAVLTAISPAMVYYSRYYIHEMLLVLFTFGALVSGCRYVSKPSAAWAVSTGIFLGLMQATKETTIMCFLSILLGCAATLLFEKWRNVTPPGLRMSIRPLHLALAILAMVMVSGLLYSSFFSNWKGIGDSLRTYRYYLDRAGAPSYHIHPWDYYLRLLTYSHAQGGPVWSEGLIAALAVPGFLAGWRKTETPGMNQRLLRFLGSYTVLMIVAYSITPYKTPWCLLGFLHGLILLAGAGTVVLVTSLKKGALRVATCALMVAAAGNLGWQAWAGSFRYEADPRNPYVYAHTGTDVFLIVRRVEELTRAHPEGLAMPVQIVSRQNLWPLPWYLRRLTGLQWWNGVSDTAPSAPVILATPDMEPALIRKLYDLPPPGQRDLYMTMFDRYVELRPQVELRGYAVKWLWDDYLRLQTEASSLSRTQP